MPGLRKGVRIVTETQLPWSSLLVDQIGVSGLITLLIRFLKHWKAVSWIGDHTEFLNRVAGAIMAAGATLGITFAATGDMSSGWNITIQVPSLFALAHTILQMSSGAVIQQMTYDRFGGRTVDVPPPARRE